MYTLRSSSCYSLSLPLTSADNLIHMIALQQHERPITSQDYVVAPSAQIGIMLLTCITFAILFMLRLLLSHPKRVP